MKNKLSQYLQNSVLRLSKDDLRSEKLDYLTRPGMKSLNVKFTFSDFKTLAIAHTSNKAECAFEE